MELRTGRVINGVIVLDDDDELEQGAAVAVLIGDSQQPVRASDEELELIRKNLAEADHGELVDARAFLRDLQRSS